MPTTASSTIHPPPICPGRLLTHEGPFPLLDPAMTPDILESNIPSNISQRQIMERSGMGTAPPEESPSSLPRYHPTDASIAAIMPPMLPGS